MTTALRPMSTGELLDRTFTLYKRHFLLFTGIAVPAPAIVLLLILLSNIAGALPGVQSRIGGTASTIILSLGALVGIIGLGMGFALSIAATIRAVSALHLSMPTTIGQSYAELRGHYLRIVGVSLSVCIRICGGSFLVYLASVIVAAMAAGAATVMGAVGIVIGTIVAVACVVGGILLGLTLFVRYGLAVQSCVIEDIPSKQAIKRSIFLSKGSRNRLLTVYVLFSTLSFAIFGCLAFLADLCSDFIQSPQIDSAMFSFAFFLTLVLTMPLATVAMSLAYYDERVRKEGFDLQMLIAGLEAPQARAAATSA